MNISRIMTQLNTVENMKNTKLTVYEGLNRFSLPIRKNSLIHIYGAEETGKTTFALDIIKRNPDKTFIYIDTYGNITKTPDNCTLFRTNRETDMLHLFNDLDKNVADCIILDAYSNVLSVKEAWDANSHEIMRETLEKLHNIISTKNTTFMVLNTTNSNGKAFNKTNYISINSVCELELLNYNYDDGIIEILPRKAIVSAITQYELFKEVE